MSYHHINADLIISIITAENFYVFNKLDVKIIFSPWNTDIVTYRLVNKTVLCAKNSHSECLWRLVNLHTYALNAFNVFSAIVPRTIVLILRGAWVEMSRRLHSHNLLGNPIPQMWDIILESSLKIWLTFVICSVFQMLDQISIHNQIYHCFNGQYPYLSLFININQLSC